MTLRDAARPYQPPRTVGDYRRVFGRFMSREEIGDKALALSRAGKHREAARLLDEAELLPHELLDAAARE